MVEVYWVLEDMAYTAGAKYRMHFVRYKVIHLLTVYTHAKEHKAEEETRIASLTAERSDSDKDTEKNSTTETKK